MPSFATDWQSGKESTEGSSAGYLLVPTLKPVGSSNIKGFVKGKK